MSIAACNDHGTKRVDESFLQGQTYRVLRQLLCVCNTSWRIFRYGHYWSW